MKRLIKNILGLCPLLLSLQAIAQEGDNTQVAGGKTSSSSTGAAYISGTQLLANNLSEQTVWLELPQGKVLALFQQHLTESAKGAIIYLSSIPLSHTSQGLTSKLRTELPYSGWQTLAVDTSSLARSTDTLNSDNEHLDEQTHLTSVTTAAALHLKQLGQLNVVIVTDNSLAATITAALAKKNDDLNNIRALVQLNLINNIASNEAALRRTFNNRDLPIIDVFIAGKELNLQTKMRLHKGVAASQKLNTYHQLKVIAADDKTIASQPNAAANRIRGMLEKIAAGTEIEGDKPNTENQ